MKIAQELETLARSLGVDLVGFADLQPVMSLITDQGGEQLAQFPFAVSIGVGLLNSIVDAIADTNNSAAVMTYHAEIYNVVNQLLDQATFRLGKLLQTQGYLAYPIPASQTLDHIKWQGLFSHKLAATQAGLGWIGRNCLLITPRLGPRVRFATVLTNAPLPAGQPLAVGCGTCQLCVQACPSGAILGPLFAPDRPRSERLMPELCEAHSEQRKTRLGVNVSGSLCGLCVQVCPFGKSER